MKRRNLNDNDQINLILETQERLDNETIESLQFFKASQESLLQQQEAEHKRLTTKYGRNHVRVQILEDKIQHGGNVSKAVNVRLDIIKSQAETFPADGWRIQGYVFNTTGESLPGLTVTLGVKSDDKSVITRARGESSYSAITGENGFYSITLNAEELRKISQQALYLIVLDSRKHIIFTSKEKLNPQPATIDFQDVAITIAREPTRPKGKTKGKGTRR